jgi:hypothetical protein
MGPMDRMATMDFPEWMRHPSGLGRLVHDAYSFLRQRLEQGFDLLGLDIVPAQLVELIEGDETSPKADFDGSSDHVLKLHRSILMKQGSLLMRGELQPAGWHSLLPEQIKNTLASV